MYYLYICTINNCTINKKTVHMDGHWMKANAEASNKNGRWVCVKPVRQQAVSVSFFSTMN